MGGRRGQRLPGGEGTEGGKDEECAWGGREGTGGPGPRGCVQGEKLAEQRNHSERWEGIVTCLSWRAWQRRLEGGEDSEERME